MISKNLPNILSVFRIIMSPFFILFMIQDEPYFLLLSLLLIFIVSLTDFFDGYLARKESLKTNLGKFLDPIADKVLIITMCTMLIINEDISGLHKLAFYIIILREITFSLESISLDV